MGRNVLGVTSSTGSLRAYGHCARGRPGAVAIAVVNLDAAASGTVLDLKLGAHNASACTLTQWTITAGVPIRGASNPLASKTSVLNGKPIVVVPHGPLPPMEGKVLLAGQSSWFPPTSYGFVLVTPSAALAHTGVFAVCQ